MSFDGNINIDILNSLHGGIYCTDRERKIIYWNRAAESITGFTSEEVVGKNCRNNILNHIDCNGVGLCTAECMLKQSIDDGKPREDEIFLHHKNGHRVPVAVRTNPLIDKNGDTIGGIELFTDISGAEGYKQRIKELEKLAMSDKLTSLPNRHYIENELQSAIDEKKNIGMEFGLIFIDIDHFKNFNDTYGHNVGDEVLQLVANTFINNARIFDVYARWGGEEFIGLIRNVNPDVIPKIADRMRILIENSFLMNDNKKLKVTISAGVTSVKENDTIECLVDRADRLLYKSKEKGRNCVSSE